MAIVTELKARLQNITRERVRRAGATISRATLLGITVYGILSFGLVKPALMPALMAILQGLSKEIAPGFIEDLLQRWGAMDKDEISLDDIIASIAQLSAEEQAALSLLTERLDVLEFTLQEALAMQNAAMLEAFRQTLAEWKGTIHPETLHAMMQEIIVQMERLEENEQRLNEIIKNRSDEAAEQLQAQREQIDSLQQQLIAILHLVQTLDQRSFEQLQGLGNINAALILLRQEIRNLQRDIRVLQKRVEETNLLLEMTPPPRGRSRPRKFGSRFKQDVMNQVWKELEDEKKDFFN